MVDIYKAIGMDFSPNVYINSSSTELVLDDDGVLNPGELVNFYVDLYNEEGWVDANAVIASLTTNNNDVIINNSISTYGSLPNGSIASPDNPFEIQLSSDIALGDIDFNIDIVGLVSGYQYSNSTDVSMSVSLFQSGFPYDTDSEIKSEPLILDLDSDGVLEVIFG